MTHPDPALREGLHWPAGQPRTRHPERARFRCTFVQARDELVAELDRLGARYPVLSTDVELRLDGMPYANRAEPADSGVAVYFLYAPESDGTLSRESMTAEQYCFACDRWDRVRDNIRAIAKSIEAIRGLKRWGAGDMLKRAMSAFKALPPDGASDWRAVLGVDQDHPRLEDVKALYRLHAAEAHPDRGGSEHEMQRLNAAWEAAQRELG